MSGIPAPTLKLRANNPASYAGYEYSEHYSTSVQTFVAEDSRRGSDNFRRFNTKCRSTKLETLA